MPLYKTITPNSQTIVKIWMITESFDELMNTVKLKPKSLQRVLKMKSGLHQCGFLSVRRLIDEFGYSDVDLHYNEFGKPYLEDGKYISITHSFNYSAVILSDLKVGIDIEKQRPIITNIASKFVGFEFSYLDENEKNYIRKLTVIWCAKESLYKLFATPGLSFKQHVLTIPFTCAEGSTVCWIDYKNQKSRYNIHFIEFDGFTCAYAIE